MLFSQIQLKSRTNIFIIFVTFNLIIFYTFTYQYEKEQNQSVFPPLRLFIFTSDNRPIENNNHDFYVLSAFINFVYARRYNYTFRYFRITYNDTRQLTKNVPFKPSCFNQVLNQERSVHWAKLQVIWHVMETYASTHDLFLYIDSDAVINNQDLSVPALLSDISWVSPSKCKNFSVNACHAAFVYDTWKKTDTFVVPNSGLLMFRSTTQFRQFIQLWWHLNMHESNFYGWYEQDSLWNILQGIPSPAARGPTSNQLASRQAWNTKVKDTIHHLNLTSHLGILDMKNFGNTDRFQFFVHMTSGLGANNRAPELLRIWQRIKGSFNQTQLLVELSNQNVVQFDATNDRIPSPILASNFTSK